jgi:hypothetical protein
MRYRWPSGVLLPLVCLTILPPALAYEKRVDCGHDQSSIGPGGEVFEADQEYVEPFGWGYVGGSPGSGVGLENSPRSRFRDSAEPYVYRRIGDFEYRFDLPDGDYLVTLGFAEWGEHGPGQRAFDVAIEESTVLADLDIFAAAGDMWRVLEYRFVASVADGQLNLELTGSVGGASLCAIEVIDLPDVPGAPGAPPGIEARDAFGRVDILWEQVDDADLVGYRVYRSTDFDGEWTRISGMENLAIVYNDVAADEDELYYYKVTAVDAQGHESSDSAIVSALAHNSLSSTLPVFRLSMTSGDLSALNDHFDSDLWEPAVFEHEGLIWTGSEARYRGNIARHFSKKNWKVKLPDGQLLNGKDTFNLNADMWDYNLARKRLAFELYREAGIITPDVEPAHLLFNGEYYGVVQWTENVDGDFIQGHGLDDRGELFKATYPNGHLRVLGGPEAYLAAYEQKSGTGEGYDLLVEFIESLDTPQDQLANVIADSIDLTEWIRYYATLVFLGEPDSFVQNYFLYRDPNVALWRFIPWDHDLSFGLLVWDPSQVDPERPIDYGTIAHQGVGWNKLVDAYLSVPHFRKRHTETLRELGMTDWSPATLAPPIDQASAAVRADGEWDFRKFPWEDNGPLGGTIDMLNGYVVDRWSSLLDQMIDFELEDDYHIYINEYMAINAATISDEQGDFDPWIELFNSSDASIDVGGMHLSNDSLVLDRWTIPPGTTIPGGGYLLIWADGEPGEGALHANFTLSPEGGTISLATRDDGSGAQSIQTARHGQQAPDVSIAMLADGLYRWRSFSTSTPGAANATGVVNDPPQIVETARSPSYPTAVDEVTITATISDAGGITDARIRYSAGLPGWSEVEMFDDGAHGDGTAQDGLYGGVLPAQPDDTVVLYFVTATDDRGTGSLDPPGAPAEVYSYVVGQAPPPLVVNEFMADNETTVADEAGEFEDWVEIHNTGTEAVDLSDMYLTDDLSFRDKWKFAAGTTIPAGGYLLVWCDNDVEQGLLHTTFKLAADGDTIALIDSAEKGRTVLDERTFGAQGADLSEGRYPDGTESWVGFPNPTPGSGNQQPDAPPSVSGSTHSPGNPAAGQPTVVTSTVTDDQSLIRVDLFFNAGGGFATTPMFDDGAHGDAAPGDSVFGATIPGQPDSAVVSYYVEAEDNAGNIRRDPQNAPASLLSYTIGFAPPPLFINEFLADNATVNVDEAGDFDDWIEIYNAGPVAYDMSGMYLTDDLAVKTKWQIPPGTTIPSEGFLLFWCDNEIAEGPLHAAFRLGAAGEQIGLFDTDANTNSEVDTHTFASQEIDRSEGRTTDAAPTWQSFSPPTPMAPNQDIDGPPVISGASRSPENPGDGDAVNVSAVVSDDGSLVRVELLHDSGGGFVAAPMFDDGGHGDGAPADGRYGGTIPAQPDGTHVDYYLEAEDDAGQVTSDPLDAPLDHYAYAVGYAPPALFINELLPDNVTINQDEAGDYDDWIEIYNAGANDHDISGMYLTDDTSQTTKWQLPAGTIVPSRGYLLIWCDDEATEGALHANFGLDALGEVVGLYDTDANSNQHVDLHVFGPQSPDVSEGRRPDGGTIWESYDPPTPGGSNSIATAVDGIATSGFNTVVDVTWSPHPHPDVVGYQVFGSNGEEGPFVNLNDDPINGMRLHRDMDLTNGQVRWYKVRAVTADNRQSPDPLPVSATPVSGQTTPVTDLRVAIEGADVVLTWTDPTNEPALGPAEVFRAGFPLPDADVDQGIHRLDDAIEIGRYVDAGEGATDAIWFYDVRSVDVTGLRASD